MPATELRGEHNRWVTIDVVMEAFNLKRSRAYALAQAEQWRTAPGTRPKQFSWHDITTTYQQRKAQQ